MNATSPCLWCVLNFDVLPLTLLLVQFNFLEDDDIVVMYVAIVALTLNTHAHTRTCTHTQPETCCDDDEQEAQKAL